MDADGDSVEVGDVTEDVTGNASLPAGKALGPPVDKGVNSDNSAKEKSPRVFVSLPHGVKHAHPSNRNGHHMMVGDVRIG